MTTPTKAYAHFTAVSGYHARSLDSEPILVSLELKALRLLIHHGEKWQLDRALVAA